MVGQEPGGGKGQGAACEREMTQPAAHAQGQRTTVVGKHGDATHVGIEDWKLVGPDKFVLQWCRLAPHDGVAVLWQHSAK